MEPIWEKIIKRPLYSKMNGIIYPSAFSPKCFRAAFEYKAQPNDVFIVTYPKCGTTWIQSVALHIFRKGMELEDMSQFLKYCPFIDMLGKEGIDNMPRPGALKTHLPLTHLRYSPQAKYIFVARNPKDCAVSFYHHTKNSSAFGFWDADFDNFFELFMAGEVEYNDYFDHLLSWCPRRNDANVFYTTYEEMKRDIRKIIIDLAKFLGDEYIEEIERDSSVLNNIILYSSFEYMRNHREAFLLKKESDDPSKLSEAVRHRIDFMSKLDIPKDLPDRNFIRKGIVGDWKNALTEEQSDRLDLKFDEKTKGTEIPNWFLLP